MDETRKTENIQFLSSLKSAALERVNDQIYFLYGNDEMQADSILFDKNGDQVIDHQPDTLNRHTLDLQSLFKQQISEDTDLINEIQSFIKQFVYVKDEREYMLFSLFTILSYSVRLFDRIPYLQLKGNKGSGKTTLMLVLKALMYNPHLFTNMTAATMFRLIEQHKPTLFVDEVETLESSGSINKPIFQILNSGYQKDGKVPRIELGKVREFSTFCLKIIAGIEDIHPTTADRCITVVMNKTDLSESKLIQPFNESIDRGLDGLVEHILFFLNKKQQQLVSYLLHPENLGLPDEIYGRNRDKWFPLLTLAKVFSNEKQDYYKILCEYALVSIKEKEKAELHSPENLAKDLVLDFLFGNKSKSLITGDKNFHYFRCCDIQELITSQDPYNYYRNKGEITKVLKRIGIVVDRRRINKSGPTMLYKIPKSFN